MMKKAKWVLFFVSVISLLGFIVLSKYEDRAIIRSVDFAVTVRVQDVVVKYCPVRCDSFLSGVSEVAGPFVSSFIVLVFTGMLFFDRSKKRLHWGVLCIPIFFVVMTLIELYGKNAVAHPAPPFFMIKHPTAFFPTYHVSAEFSYPSGHAARALFISILACVVWMRSVQQAKRRTINTMLIPMGLTLFVFAVGVSKVYLGHHWFSDMIAGVLLASSAIFAALLFVPVDAKDKPDYNT